MKEIKIIDKDLRERFQHILKKYQNTASKEDLDFIKLVLLRYKEHSHNEYYVVLILVYGFLSFGLIKINDDLVTDEDRTNISKIIKSYNFDINGDFKNYIFDMIEYDDDLFLVKVIIKYSILNSTDKYIKLIGNLENYTKSIGYLIPLLTFKDIHFLSFYQDYYFKNIYPLEYTKLKKQHLKKTSKLELPGEYIISKINTINNLMKMMGVSGTMSLRKKSYFSLYGKYNNSYDKEITDSIGIRIIFNNLHELNIFKRAFEIDHIYYKKKDYIKQPKINGYKALHYSYLTAFRNSQILIELQIKTKKMDKELKKNMSLSHYAYTIKSHKWHSLFKEVHAGYDILKNYLSEKR